MMSAGRIAAAIELLEIIETARKRPADAVANDYFRMRRFIGSGDRRAVSDRVWTVLRARRRLEWWLSGSPVTARLLIAASLLTEGWALSGVTQTFSGGQYAAPALNAAEKSVLAKIEGHTLDHPSIPTIYDYFFDGVESRFYLVMKYIDGGDLAARQRVLGGRVDELTVTRWAIDTCDVLDYIHSQDPPIIYRDLKPANLMIDTRTNRVMLVDFGIARFVSPTQKGVTAIGTMGYAPPELFAGNVEARSDIYSLGATMFHLMTGVDPQDNPLLIFDFDKNPKPRQINPAISVPRAIMHDPVSVARSTMPLTPCSAA